MILSIHGIISSGISQFTNGLLDTYTGAAVAYSLRRLSIAYTGSSIRVRRASDNVEQDIGFNGENLNISALTSFCSGTNGFITTWYDQSGNNRNASQTTAGNQPQIVSNGSYLGYVQFLNTAPNQNMISSYNYALNTAHSSFVVGQNTGSAVFGGTTGSNNFYAVSTIGSGSSSLSNFSLQNYFRNGTTIGSTRGNIYTAMTNFSLLTSLVTPQQSITLAIGYPQATFNNQRIKEMIVFPNQSVSRTGVESNIITYYGL